MRHIKYVFYVSIIAIGYWILAFLLMESIEPFLDANFIVDLIFTATVFVLFFLLNVRIYKKTFKSH